MLPLLETQIPKVGFLASFFQTPQENIKKSPTVEIDVIRNKNTYAVDIKAGTGARYNQRSLYANKKYAVPAYKEGFTLNAEELQYKMAGENAYEAAQRDYIAQAVQIMAKDALVVANKINYAIEKQARDAFFNGKITLINGDEIDFAKKVTHAVSPTTKWDNSGDPIADLTAWCQLVRVDGMVSGNMFDLIVSEDTLNALYANAIFKDRANLRRADLLQITMPQYINTAGAVFHGIFSVGNNTINLWTYPAFYEIPTGFGFASEGTKEGFIPAESALLLARGVRYDLVFAGIPRLYTPANAMVSFVGADAGRMLPFVYEDRENEAIKYGLESRPLCIPTEIDTFVSVTNILK